LVKKYLKMIMTRKFAVLVFIATTMISTVKAQCTTGNCYEGNGSYLFENGDLYNGLWKKGIMNGYGVYEYVNGDIYKGAWKDGFMSGRGTYSYNNGNKYVGEWKDGKMEGRGHFYWQMNGNAMNNAKYEGFFKNGEPVNLEISEAQPPAEPPAHK
ncbi:hypothetical protein ACFLR1_07350, partial [Bacteroidota bacterium]